MGFVTLCRIIFISTNIFCLKHVHVQDVCLEVSRLPAAHNTQSTVVLIQLEFTRGCLMKQRERSTCTQCKYSTSTHLPESTITLSTTCNSLNITTNSAYNVKRESTDSQAIHADNELNVVNLANCSFSKITSVYEWEQQLNKPH